MSRETPNMDKVRGLRRLLAKMIDNNDGNLEEMRVMLKFTQKFEENPSDLKGFRERMGNLIKNLQRDPNTLKSLFEDV